ncbi:NIPSNAP family protein [bacterium]|nr:NIPSNAP family protein [bacterium]
MLVQLRTYTLVAGAGPDWERVFVDHIRPIRESLGFTVPAAWSDPEADRFTWLMAFAGDRAAWDAADAAFHASPARRALAPDPAGLIVSIETRFVQWVG